MRLIQVKNACDARAMHVTSQVSSGLKIVLLLMPLLEVSNQNTSAICTTLSVKCRKQPTASSTNQNPVVPTLFLGLSLGFIAYPEAAQYLPPPQLWCALFFFMSIFLGIDSQVRRAIHSNVNYHGLELYKLQCQ